MGIKWDRVFENEKRQFEKMSELDRFIYFLLLQYGSPYGWGKENPESSDCSGAVCLALYAATGLLIRTTADDLYRRVFTKVNPRPGDIRAVFYITKKDKRHGDRPAAAGTVVHVAGILDDGIILNSQEPSNQRFGAKVRRITDVSDWFQRNGHEVAVRGLDREALARLAAEGKTRYGLDSEFSGYFDLGA
ncbi:MAG: C40 family peptidase [Treponema sp.]|jgi:murein DD-endopeptidase|nr:C40 family peptidase [Treponema sp.]